MLKSLNFITSKSQITSKDPMLFKTLKCLNFYIKYFYFMKKIFLGIENVSNTFMHIQRKKENWKISHENCWTE